MTNEPLKVWAKVKKRNATKADAVMEFDRETDTWETVVGALSAALHLSRPVILSKHIDQLHRFMRTAFLPDDFVEHVDFDKFEIEIIPEKKKDRRQ